MSKKTKVTLHEGKDREGMKYYVVQYGERTWLAWILQDWHIVKVGTDKAELERVFNELTN